MPEVITKHLDEDIWELRPGNNREYAKSAGSEDRREIEDCERLSHAISLAINGLHNFGALVCYTDPISIYFSGGHV